jgi:RHS repeat-associated protein
MVQWSVSANTNDEFAYDASGNRTVQRATSGGTTTLTVYAFGLEDFQYSGGGTLLSTTSYYSLAGRLMGVITGLISPLTVIFLTDALGNLMATFSNNQVSAAIQGNQVYGPYGNSLYSVGTMDTARAYTGQYSDTLTGLDYYISRYYDPVVGIFLSPDVKEGNGRCITILAVAAATTASSSKSNMPFITWSRAASARVGYRCCWTCTCMTARAGRWPRATTRMAWTARPWCCWRTTLHAPHSTVTTTISEVIHTNKKHPFFTEEKGFLPVGQLKLGMHVLRADGRYGVITGYKLVPGAKTMYNLEVAKDHTFTVGVGQWVVHNSATCGGDNNNSDDGVKTPTGSFKKMNDSYLKQLGIDAHQLKYEVLGKGAKISSFDIYQDGNGDLYLMQKGGSQSSAIWTTYNISDFLDD